MILKWIDNLGKKICKGLNTPSPISPKNRAQRRAMK